MDRHFIPVLLCAIQKRKPREKITENRASQMNSQSRKSSSSSSTSFQLQSPVKLLPPSNSSRLSSASKEKSMIRKKTSEKGGMGKSERISYIDKDSEYGRRKEDGASRKAKSLTDDSANATVSLKSTSPSVSREKPQNNLSRSKLNLPLVSSLYEDSQLEGFDEVMADPSDVRSKRLGRELEDSTCGPNASQFASQNVSRYHQPSGSVLDGSSYQIEKYFGNSSRVEFFDRLHYLSAKRGVVKRGRKPNLHGDDQGILTKLINTDPYYSKTSDSLSDYPFAPHRQDDDFEEGADADADAQGSEVDDDRNRIGNENSSRNSLSTVALLVPYDQGFDLSPRTKYLNGCLEKEINPRASLILRKNVSTVLNLQHHGMGDQHGVIFAESLRDLPMIHTINLTDNNLTDISLTPIIESIIALPSVTNVDLSQNKVDGQCSIALASYLKTPSCTLRRLVLKSADIDDTEADNFVKSLMNNSTLQELDLSHNLIGRAESLNTVRPEFNTGGEALALLLQSENCRLESLCLSWNMIRLESAVSLTSALGTNLYLRYLDLSYNSLGERGGEYLGKSLLTNQTLQTLLLNHNNLTSSACFAICVGIEENYTLKRVNLDGNPIGEAGAKYLTQIPVTVGGRVKVSASGCNLEVKYEKDRMFNPYDPCGSYALNCDDCYHRAIAFKILRTLASNPGYTAMLFSWSPDPLPPQEKLKPPPPPPMRNNPTKAELMMMQRRVPTMIPPPSASSVKISRDILPLDWKSLDEVKRTTLEGLYHLQAAAKNVSYAKELFEEFDRDHSGALDIDELMKLLSTLGVSTDRADVALAISSCDSETKNELTWNDFLQFLRFREMDATHRIKEMVETPVIFETPQHLHLPSKQRQQQPQQQQPQQQQQQQQPQQPQKRKYIPPLTGSLYIILSDEFNISSQKILSSADHSHLVEFVKYGVENVSKALQFSIANTRVREREALQLHELMNSEIKNDVTVAEMLLAQIADPHDARSYMNKIFGYDREAIKRLEVNLGNAMKPIYGIYDGYYSLDLSISSDRLCLKKLLEQSQKMKEKAIQRSLFESGLTGDLSQHGDWSSFRNAFYNGSQCYVRPDLFSPMPECGSLSFDFIGTDRPPRGVAIAPDSRCLNIMTNVNLITTEEKFSLQLLLNEMKLKAKRAMEFHGSGSGNGGGKGKGNDSGNDNGETLFSKEKAEDIQLVKLVFYQMLPKRAKYYKEVRVRESETGGIVKYTEEQERRELEKEEKAKKKNTKKMFLRSLSSMQRQKKLRGEVSSSSSSDSDSDSGDDNGDGNEEIDSDLDLEEDEDGPIFSGGHGAPRVAGHSSTVAVGRRFSQLRRLSALGASSPVLIPKGSLFPLRSSNSFGNSPLSSFSPSSSLPPLSPSHTTPAPAAAAAPPSSSPSPTRQRKLALTDSTKQEYIYDMNSKMVTLYGANVSRYVKCYRTVETLVEVLSRLWIRCRHLAAIVQSFNQGRVDRVKFFGTYRVELIIQVYCRLVDLHNFDLVLETLSAFEIGCLTCRMGLLHFFNPLKLDSWHCLDLSKREERVAAKILALLSTIESGKNWIDPTFRWAYQLPVIPGWMLTQSWLEERTMPYRGILTVEYFSGQGIGLLGCNPLVSVRKSFLSLVALDEEDLLDDEHNISPNGQPIHLPQVGTEAAMARKEAWMRLLCPPDSTSAKISRGEDILTTLIDEQNRHNLSYHIKREAGSDDESDGEAEARQHLATISRVKTMASKMLTRQRSKITELKRPVTAPPSAASGGGGGGRVGRETIRMTTINLKRRTSRLK